MTKSETQLTLQELRDKLGYYFEAKPYRNLSISERADVESIVDIFQQALTSLKTEMEKKKRKDTSAEDLRAGTFTRGQDLEVYGYNQAISECQKLLEDKLNNNAHSVEEK